MKFSFGTLDSGVWGGKYLLTMVSGVSATAVTLGPVNIHDYYCHAPTSETPMRAAVQKLPRQSHHAPGMTWIPRTMPKERWTVGGDGTQQSRMARRMRSVGRDAVL